MGYFWHEVGGVKRPVASTRQHDNTGNLNTVNNNVSWLWRMADSAR